MQIQKALSDRDYVSHKLVAHGPYHPYFVSPYNVFNGFLIWPTFSSEETSHEKAAPSLSSGNQKLQATLMSVPRWLEEGTAAPGEGSWALLV